jgi:hypothetical protein
MAKAIITYTLENSVLIDEIETFKITIAKIHVPTISA